MQPIHDVAAELGLPSEQIVPWGPGRAKVLATPGPRRGRLVLVSAMNPTPTGEGKTTMAIALGMGLRRLGVKTCLALREPSQGPVFGKKGGGTGGGRAVIEPQEAINLHFTGDLHAIAAAHNILAALVDHAIDQRRGPDPRKVRWRRVMDVDDKALRRVIVGLDGTMRESAFDITAASEVMATLCLAEDRADLEARLARLIVGMDAENKAVTAADLRGVGSMSALLAEAMYPNLVQTLEGGPTLVHGGPFANIAHGCNSRIATRLALAHADVVLSEAGFGFDLGGEKFLDIKCRADGLWPSAVALVATVKALRYHGKDGRLGLDLLEHHLAAVARFGLPALVVLNHFPDDPEEVIGEIRACCAARGAGFAVCDGFAEGGAGSEAAAAALMEVIGEAGPARCLYPVEASIPDKLDTIARSMYGAAGVEFTDKAKKDIAEIVALGGGQTPVCVAKTPLSVTDDPKRTGLVRDHVLHVRELRYSAGAGFVVALAGDIQTMPALPREPAAWRIHVDAKGRIRGLMQGD